MEQLTVSFVHISDIQNNPDYYLSFLTPEELARADRFVHPSDRFLAVGSAFLIRFYCGKNAVIRYTDHKKPMVSGCFFNVSHSVDLAAIVLSQRYEVGIDIEKRRDGFEELREQCCSITEFNSGVAFLDLFTAKESLAKAEGSGLSLPLPEIPGLPLDGFIRYKDRNFYRQSYNGSNGYSVSIVQENEPFLIKDLPETTIR